MSTDIREEIIAIVREWSPMRGHGANAEPIADAILASPSIARIRAEALIQAAAEIGDSPEDSMATDEDLARYDGHQSAVERLREIAAREALPSPALPTERTER